MACQELQISPGLHFGSGFTEDTNADFDMSTSTQEALASLAVPPTRLSKRSTCNVE